MHSPRLQSQCTSNGPGAYFLANDEVLDLSIAFLNSFRLQHPEMPLCLIPFDDNCEEIKQLSSRYNYTVFTDDTVLARCDAISRKFHGTTVGHYRKFAAWEGRFASFQYFDVDTVLVSPASFVFEFLKDFQYIASHSNIPKLIQFVWEESIYTTNALSVEQIGYSANTGFFCSKREVDLLRRFEEILPQALALKNHMVLWCKEQPALNFAITRLVRDYTSLHVLRAQTGRRDISLEQWGGVHRLTIGGRLFGLGTKRFLVHWAGRKPHLCIRARDWAKGMARSEGVLPLGSVRHFFPCGSLWHHYRYHSRFVALQSDKSKRRRMQTVGNLRA